MTIEWQSWLQIIIVVAAMLAFAGWTMAHLFWHIKPTRLDTFEDLAVQIGRGEPALIYFYSNF